MESRNLPSIAELYSGWIKNQNEENVQERYSEDVRHLYHASGAGMCMRKHFFSITDAPVTDPPAEQSQRLLRLGTIVHSDFAMSIQHFNWIRKEKERTKEKENIYNSSYIELLRTIKNIRTEGEINLPDLNVRGFYDAVFEMETGEVYLFDFKTIGSYPYKRKFGRVPDKNPALHHEMQLATYGLGVQKEYGRLDGMFLYYYNKDNSGCKQKEVSLDMLDNAKRYWKETLDVSSGAIAPEIELHKSPRYTWECNYCQYSTHCQEADLL
jgi:CRISPR/Cas system-associated exonuclease Cas4 (RecB family)